ncbi:MAG: DUF951 domain-containing protein [Dehalococcoidia bacterium]
MVTPFELGDVLTVRKAHPCGGHQWRVERLGADIGIRCTTCGHYVLAERRRLERRIKERQPGRRPFGRLGAGSGPTSYDR